MPKPHLSEEEILARKLLGFLGTTLGLLAFAGAVFFFLSTPPSAEEAPAAAPSHESPGPAGTGTSAGADVSPVILEAFKDRMAQVQLGGWPLVERKTEARRLLAGAPTAQLRADVEKLIADLAQEERFEKLAAFETVRHHVNVLALEKRFVEAEQALGAFAKGVEGFEDDTNELRRQLAGQRDRAYEQNRRLAAEAIARGDVDAATRLSRESVPLGPPDDRAAIEAWVKRAEERRGALATTQPTKEPAEIAELPPEGSSAGEDTEKAKESATEAHNPPSTSQEAPPSAEGAGTGESRKNGFAEVVTVTGAEGTTFAATSSGTAVTVIANAAPCFLDERVPAEAFNETLRRGTGLWLLGQADKKQGVLKPFGRIVVRKIENVACAFLPENFRPDTLSADAALQGRNWLFGKVELGFPVLRVSINNEPYLVIDDEIKLVRRAKVDALPALPQGAAVWVEGRRENARIVANRIVVLASELASDPAYRRSCP
jgi:hypothetical protein